MSTFDHANLMQSINECLTPFHNSHQELQAMLTICVYMGGGSALMYSAEALKAWDTLA